MKKHIFTLLIVSVFARASAQNYNYAEGFNGVLQHVDSNLSSTGMVYNQMQEEGILMQFDPRIIQSDDNYQDTNELHNYKYSVGVDIGWFDGVSLKVNLGKNIFLQTDIGMGIFLNLFALTISPDITVDLGGQLFLFYENKFPRRTNTYWLAGGGLCFAALSPTDQTKKVNTIKGGAKALLGIEYYFGGKAPLSIQVDTRLGYNVMYSPKDTRRGVFIPSDNPYHYFDYGFVFTLRYHFGKKN